MYTSTEGDCILITMPLLFIGIVIWANIVIASSLSLSGIAKNVKNFVQFDRKTTQQISSPYNVDSELKKGIAKFYDQSSGIWLDVWGEDMHHGYYPAPDFRDHQAAQRLMIDKSLAWGFGSDAMPSMEGKKMVDVGCGVGGSSRYIVKKYGGSAQGLSLSPFQVSRANALSAVANLSKALQYQVADAMNMPFSPDSFDLSMPYVLSVTYF